MKYLTRTAVLSLGLLLALFTLPAVAQTGDQGAGTSGSTTAQTSRHHDRKANASGTMTNPNATDTTAPGAAATDQNAQNPSSSNPNASATDQNNPNNPNNPNTAATTPAGTTSTNTGGGGGWGPWGLVGLFGLFGLGGRRSVAATETRTDVRRIA